MGSLSWWRRWGAALQVCDVWFDDDSRVYSHGTAALNVLRRENDRTRKGHHARLGRASNTDLDAVQHGPGCGASAKGLHAGKGAGGQRALRKGAQPARSVDGRQLTTLPAGSAGGGRAVDLARGGRGSRT